MPRDVYMQDEGVKKREIRREVTIGEHDLICVCAVSNRRRTEEELKSFFYARRDNTILYCVNCNREIRIKAKVEDLNDATE